ncbi:estradiol 17-beta-dehydrogenase [Eremomyces bilateralis CBS 781.70]|uniref:Short-chain dehydrogenase/reductase 3 n=1 Tax=Eremomyces bilateralis CBS 781.70 TaxID=1392243 RepID=A0A6G1GDN4_9PEZI|nr:estradiol 17-beta-dehydrogenase [Eremomyces bilateralis CBS 781.70]KAF1816153.1 estradiol 17-beta-dehydrogenase [Eremomyces bilateralis CBS 781.70]
MTSLQRLTLKLVGGIIGLAFEPAITGSTLAAMRFLPENVQRQFLELDFIPSWIQDDKVKLGLWILLALGFGKRLNRALNTLATNNWRISAQEGWKWDEEIAVVTGGSNGIGKQIVLGLVKRGVRVAILDVQELPEDLKENPSVSYFKCDVTSASDTNEAIESVRKTLGDPSILVNNAGIGGSYPILHTPDDYLHKIMGINLLAHWTTTKACLPSMIAQNKGHIVTIASMASYLALPAGIPYSASKAGALAFHEGLTCEIKHVYKAPGIVTTVAHPSWVRTDMTAKDAKQIEKGGKMMTPEYVGGRIVEQIFSRKGAQLILPDNLWAASGIRWWPNWLQEIARDAIGRPVGRAINRGRKKSDGSRS